MTEFRIEKDSMGDVKVPAQAYYGAQTQRDVANFPISHMPLPKKLIHALGLTWHMWEPVIRQLARADACWPTTCAGTERPAMPPRPRT